MLWLPFVRRVGEGWIRVLIAFTVGLLAFLGVDAALEGLEIAGAAPSAFGGAELVLLGALVAYLALAGVDSYLRAGAGARCAARRRGARGPYLALLVAIGIGLHNLGEGLAIGSAYAAGALALGAFLVVGFAIHNTTEGLAIVAPLAEADAERSARLAGPRADGRAPRRSSAPGSAPPPSTPASRRCCSASASGRSPGDLAAGAGDARRRRPRPPSGRGGGARRRDRWRCT